MKSANQRRMGSQLPHPSLLMPEGAKDMSGQFEGKTALVTGAGSGIGRASALTFARKGARVVVADFAVQSGEETVRLIKEAGGDATFIMADVSKSTDVQNLIDKAVSHYGRLDCAHNNAGNPGSLCLQADCSEEEFDRVMGINLKGIWLCMKYEIARMIKQGGGAIVNTASISGLVGVGSQGAYVASKYGVVGLTKGAALDYAASGIRVNALCPGATSTNMLWSVLNEDSQALHYLTANTPLGRLGKPQEMADTVVFLCSDEASYITGHTMVVDGGYTAH